MSEDQLRKEHHEAGLPWGLQFLGPYPITVRRMARDVLSNITVHLANEHGLKTSGLPEQHHIQHLLAHLYGRFRRGQEHYHEAPEFAGSMPTLTEIRSREKS